MTIQQKCVMAVFISWSLISYVENHLMLTKMHLQMTEIQKRMTKECHATPQTR